jgi:hypothetical protein
LRQRPENDEAITRYLLGECSEQEEEAFERRFFDDDSFFEECLAVEDELIDSYARGELSGPERERFEKHFLASSHKRQSVRFTRDLIRVSSQSPRLPIAAAQKPTPLWQSLVAPLRTQHSNARWLLAAALLVVIAGGAWVLIQRVREQQAEPGRLAQQEQDAQRDAQAREKEDQNQRPKEGDQPTSDNKNSGRERARAGLIALTLSPSHVRGDDEAQTLTLAPGVDMVRLQLELERDENKRDEYRSYRAVLGTPEGNQVLSRSALKLRSTSSGKAVILRLPAEIFSRTDYIITLSGTTARSEVETVGEYYFKVKK